MTRTATTGIRAIIGAFALLLSQSAYGQIIPYTSLDPEALQAAVRAISDSSGTEAMELSGVSGFGVSFDDGTAAYWQFTFTDPSRATRSAVVLKTTSGNQYFVSPPYTIPEGTPTPYALDTTGDYSRSEQIIDPLRSNATLVAYLTRFPETAVAGVIFDTYTPAPIPVPSSFPAGAPFWQLTTTRHGDSVMACLVSAITGETHCELYFDTNVSFQYKENLTGNVAFGATNYGIFGNNPQAGTGTLFVPRGSTLSYLFGSGLWFSTMKSDTAGSPRAERSFITYDPNSGGSWGVPGEGYDVPAFAAHPDLYHSVEYDQETGIKSNSESDLNWPLWLRGFEADPTMLEPGEYIPVNGERVGNATGALRPAFVPTAMEQFTSRYNDGQSFDYSLHEPIGLRVEENIFVPNEDLVTEAVIVQYRVMNVSDDTLHDCAIATAMDFDLGNAANDRAGFYQARPDLRTAYAVTPAEALTMGTLLMTMLESPTSGEDGFIDNGSRRAFRESGRVSTFQSWTIGEDTAIATSRLNFMTAGTIDPDLGPGDRRALLVGERFSMLPGDTAYYAIAYSVLPSVRTITGTSPELESKASALINLYYGQPLVSVPSRPGMSARDLKLGVMPNPARRSARLAIDVPTRSQVDISITSTLGEEVMRMAKGTMESGLHDMPIDLEGLGSGLYLITVTAGDHRRTIPLTVTK